MRYNGCVVSKKLSYNPEEAIKQELFDFLPNIGRESPILFSWMEFFKKKRIPFIITRHPEHTHHVKLYKEFYPKKREGI